MSSTRSIRNKKLAAVLGPLLLGVFCFLVAAPLVAQASLAALATAIAVCALAAATVALAFVSAPS